MIFLQNGNGIFIIIVDTSSTQLQAAKPEGKTPLFGLCGVCAAEQGMVFKVLSLKQGIQFHY